MSKVVSLVYRNIYIYRIIMNILYGMKYKIRFDNINNLIRDKDKDIVELCFGDIYIAQYALITNRKWIGLDINESFVKYANSKNYKAINRDILVAEIPKNDVCIMIGSLYHFIDDIELVLRKMLESSNKIIISEPIKNLSNNKYVGFFAKKLADAGRGDEEFRFTESSFIEVLDRYKNDLLFDYEVISKDRDILVVPTCK